MQQQQYYNVNIIIIKRKIEEIDLIFKFHNELHYLDKYLFPSLLIKIMIYDEVLE